MSKGNEIAEQGWWLRSDIIWNKPNPMPESVRDRPTKSHEYIFLLTKSGKYFYDTEAIKEQCESADPSREAYRPKYAERCETGERFEGNGKYGKSAFQVIPKSGRNKRSVWKIATQPYPEAHFATFPEELPRTCILAGTSAKGCCAKCGAPWKRIIEKIGQSTYALVKGDRSWREMSQIANEQGTTPSRPNSGQTRFENGTQPHLDATPSKTIGWQPTCKCLAEFEGFTYCPPAPLAPCTVLDPFAGSGTTGKVALELGRKATLIELNPTYVNLIEKRCNVQLELA